MSDSVKRHLRGRHLSVLSLKFDFISDGGCTREEQIALSLKRHLFPHGGREPKAFWICFSRVHLPSEIKSNFKFKTLKRHLLNRHLTLSDHGHRYGRSTEGVDGPKVCSKIFKGHPWALDSEEHPVALDPVGNTWGGVGGGIRKRQGKGQAIDVTPAKDLRQIAPENGRYWGNGTKVTESAQNADFRRKPQIFAGSPLLLGIQAFGGCRQPQIFADNRSLSQETAGNRSLGSVTLSPSP